MPVLFAAEVDQIQHVLFRAARQRQVAGGSRLLHALGEEAKARAIKYYGAAEDDVKKWGGGSFLVVFADRHNAEKFGQELAGAVRLLLDASITIPDPIEYEAGSFQEANDKIQANLRRQKREKHSRVATPHAPTTAFCQSSGVGLAIEDKPPVFDPGAPNQYISRFADRMGQAGAALRGKGDSFLGEILAMLHQDYQEWAWPKNADAVAAFDEARGNVAYLVADGNEMGRWFDACSEDQIKRFPDALNHSVRRAIAKPLYWLIERLIVDEDEPENQRTLPILPLIVAGDDVFLLLPALYALDFARLFCQTFTEEMLEQEVVKELRAEKSLDLPVMSAAVVFCKGSYPYHLAHAYAEERLLPTAKALSKGTAAGAEINEAQRPFGSLAFDLIAGGQLVHGKNGKGGDFQPTAGPYWVVDGEQPLAAVFREAALPIDALLEARWVMRSFPQKRLVEIESLYEPAKLPKTRKDLDQSVTNKELIRLRKRMAARSHVAGANGSSAGDPMVQILNDALKILGDRDSANPAPGRWMQFSRPEQFFFGQGMPDLMHIWLYAQSFKHKIREYRDTEEA